MSSIGSRAARTGLPLALCWCTVVGSSTPALSQEPEARKPPPVTEQIDQLLWDRGREVLHPADPLDLVGIEEGDNSFRDRTPILEQSDRAVAMVDATENYRRRLAMYAEGQVFHSPLPLAGGVAGAAAGNRSLTAPSPTSGPAKQVGELEEGSSWIVILSLPALLALFLIGLIWSRYRRNHAE